MERLFGVLFRQLRIIDVPYFFINHVRDMDIVAKACGILNNMIPEHHVQKGTMNFQHKLNEVESQTKNIDVHVVVKAVRRHRQEEI